jgi:protein-S-isoprenylcysteine O-methyltransferase Ste14
MQAEETIRVALWIIIGANALLWIHFHRKARRNSLLVFGTLRGPLPVIATWAWAVPFYAVMVVNLVMPSSLQWAVIEVPGWVRACGALVLMPTPLLCWWVLSSLGNNFTEAFAAAFGQTLVTRGPYTYVRHPLYALEFIFLASIALATANLIILIYALSGILAIRLIVIPHEEQYLLERFGENYRKYRKRTGLLLPKLTTSRRSVTRRGIDSSLARRSSARGKKAVHAHTEAAVSSDKRDPRNVCAGSG